MYDIIYSDPPWAIKKSLRNVRPNQTRKLDYNTLSLEEIINIHKQVFDNFTNQKHNVFMWTVDKFLVDTEMFMRDLGYELHARIIWNKTNGIAPAFTLRFSHEYLLWFYKKGNMLMPCKESRGKFTDVLTEPATTHSTKPQCARDLLNTLFPNAKKLELFARKKFEGFDTWGNEVENDIKLF